MYLVARVYFRVNSCNFLVFRYHVQYTALDVLANLYIFIFTYWKTKRKLRKEALTLPTNNDRKELTLPGIISSSLKQFCDKT